MAVFGSSSVRLDSEMDIYFPFCMCITPEIGDSEKFTNLVGEIQVVLYLEI